MPLTESARVVDAFARASVICSRVAATVFPRVSVADFEPTSPACGECDGGDGGCR